MRASTPWLCKVEACRRLLVVGAAVLGPGQVHNAAVDYLPCRGGNPRMVQRARIRGQHEAENSIIPHITKFRDPIRAQPVCTSSLWLPAGQVDRIAPTEEAHRGRES